MLRAVARQAADEDENATAARARAVAIDAELAAAEAAGGEPASRRGRQAVLRPRGGQPGRRRAARGAGRGGRRPAGWRPKPPPWCTERASRDRLHEAHLAAREQAVETRATALGVREARIDGMRAELAATMTDGSPCPVCGSLDHPDPVEPTFEPVSRDAEDAANALADQATAKADKAGQDVAAADGRIGELAQRLRQAGFAALETRLPRPTAADRRPGRRRRPPPGRDRRPPSRPSADPAAALAAALQADPASLSAAARQADADAKRLEAEAARLAAQAADAARPAARA